MGNFAIEKATAILIESVVLQSPSNPIQVDIKNVVSDIDIFEHIDKPYVSAVLSFTDGDNIVSALNISGAETVDIVLKANTVVAVPVEIQFYIDKVITAAKGNETNELVALHLTQTVNYRSNLQNVNKAYSGKPTTIMAKIASEFLDTTIKASTEPPQKMKLIVPNLTPLNAMSWIKNKISTEKGYPFYLYSYLGGEELFLVDLKTMLEKPAINEGAPYTFTESAIPSPDENFDDTSRRRIIMDYQVKDTDNLYSLIDRGLIGATHQFIDVTNNEVVNHKHNMIDVTDTLVEDDLIKKNPLFSLYFEDNGTPYGEIQSRHISQIASTQAFEGFDSYNQSETVGQYKLNSTQQAMVGLIRKQPLSIIVNGIDFLQIEGNSTIGNKLEVMFPANLNDEGKSSDRFDKKKSGNYLIYSAKHSISRDAYTIALTCVKISNGDV